MCCNKPDYDSSTYGDSCKNCGYYCNYITGEEGWDYSLIDSEYPEEED